MQIAESISPNHLSPNSKLPDNNFRIRLAILKDMARRHSNSRQLYLQLLHEVRADSALLNNGGTNVAFNPEVVEKRLVRRARLRRVP